MALSEPAQQHRPESLKRAGERVPSGNRVKSRPAKAAVINGILSQLGSTDAGASLEASRHTSFTKPDFSDFDQGSRPTSPVSFASAPSVPFSPNNNTTIRPSEADSDDEAYPDVATPPVVPTMRSPTRLSQQMTPRSLSYGVHTESTSAAKRTSLRSSTRDVSHSQMSMDSSPEPRRRQLRRVESHETLRQAEPDKDFQPDSDFILNGLGSLATVPPPVDDTPFIARSPRRTSPKMLGTASMYLRDDDYTTAGDQDLSVKAADRKSINSEHSLGSSAGPSTPVVPKLRSAARPSPITDSIPLRTSSLRLSQSPASSRRRAKGKASARTGSLVRTISEDTADEQWAGLGEDDETVKRIRELRKKRESRMLSDDSHPRQTPALTRDLVDTPLRPASNASGEIAVPKILGQQQQQQHQQLTTNDHSSSNDPGHPTSASTVDTGRLQVPIRLSTPPLHTTVVSSSDGPLSLDYSYAQAVDALQTESAQSSPKRRAAAAVAAATALNHSHASHQPQQSMSAVRPFIAIQHRRTTSNTSVPNNNASPLRLKKQRDRLNSEDGDDKSRRRKSMSDARRPGDDGLEPQRRDSVEIAVQEYLSEPRLSQHVFDPQSGRRISFSEVGDPRGAAVMVCIGMGLTRFVTAFFDELATTLRLRLITIERPGVGESEPYPPNDRSGPLMWASDVTTVTEHLGISKFSMLAHSAGAIYALATALTLPHYVRGSIHLLAPWIPPSQLEAVSYPSDNAIPAGALPRSQRILRVLPAPFLRMANNSYILSSLKPEKRKSASSPTGRRRTSSESPTRARPKRPATATSVRPENPRRESLMLMDQFMPDTNPMENFPLATRDDEKIEHEVAKRRSSVFLGATISPNDPSFTFAGEALSAAEHSARERQNDFSSRLTQRTWEYAIKDSNPATDLLVCLERNREIGFRYTDVVRRVIITSGAEDKRVPVGNVKWLADQMNRAVVQRYAVSRDTLSFDPGREPGCELRVLENEGHGLMASPIIMADVLTEIAGYWTAEERGRRPSHNL